MAKKDTKPTTKDPETTPEPATGCAPILILPHLAGRIFGTPLAIQSEKADIIMSALTPRMLGEMKFEAIQPIQKAQGFDEVAVSSGGIAVIQVHGTLVKRASFLDSMSGLVSYSSLEAQFQAALEAPEVTGILLSFDSPGGEVNGMVDAADLIFQSRGQKPIWALADDGAFSAAYGLASAADRIFVPITGEVGSVGVLAMHRNQAGHDEKVGLSYEFVFAGAQKVDGNPHEALSDGARERIQRQVNATHTIFTDMVAKHRGTTGEAIRALEAGIFQGQAAIDNGLADEIGSFRAVLSKFEASVRDETGDTDVATLQGNKNGRVVVSLEDHRAELEKEAKVKAVQEHAAYRTQVQQLCELAGKPTLAPDFIEKDISLDAVRKALVDGRAADADKTVVNTQHSGEVQSTEAPTESTREIYARRRQQSLGQ